MEFKVSGFAVVIGLSIVCSSSHGQTVLPSVADSLPHVTRDAKVDLLLRAHIRQNRTKTGISGYRVQVYSGSGNEARAAANEVRRQVIANHPDLTAHLVYQPPNFKVRVGDCRTEVEAIRLKQQLAYGFPQGFVVRDEIRLPVLSIEKRSETLSEEQMPDVQVRPPVNGEGQ
jgi:hypothetical protein